MEALLFFRYVYITASGKGKNIMRKYTTPYLANFGECKDVIKGACSWGGENLTLDKRNTHKKFIFRWVYVAGGKGEQKCIGRWGCNTDKSNC